MFVILVVFPFSCSAGTNFDGYFNFFFVPRLRIVLTLKKTHPFLLVFEIIICHSPFCAYIFSLQHIYIYIYIYIYIHSALHVDLLLSFSLAVITHTHI
jgi:hypothetical protein